MSKSRFSFPSCSRLKHFFNRWIQYQFLNLHQLKLNHPISGAHQPVQLVELKTSQTWFLWVCVWRRERYWSEGRESWVGPWTSTGVSCMCREIRCIYTGEMEFTGLLNIISNVSLRPLYLLLNLVNYNFSSLLTLFKLVSIYRLVLFFSFIFNFKISVSFTLCIQSISLLHTFSWF